MQSSYAQGSIKLGINSEMPATPNIVYHSKNATMAAGCMPLRHRVVIYQHTVANANSSANQRRLTIHYILLFFFPLLFRFAIEHACYVDDLSRSRGARRRYDLTFPTKYLQPFFFFLARKTRICTHLCSLHLIVHTAIYV